MVNIEVILNDEKSVESKAASRLKYILEESIPENAKGDIYIISSAWISGGNVKDIDLICYGNMIDCVIEDKIDKQHLDVKSFFCTIELKSHSISGIYYKGTNFYVKYNDSLHNVTQQSRNQGVAVIRVLNSNLFSNTHVSNLIWFDNITSMEYKSLTKNILLQETNIITSETNFLDIIRKVKSSKNRVLNGNSMLIDDLGITKYQAKDYLINIQNTFVKNISVLSQMTRSKIEEITRTVLSDEKDNQNIISGRAGTGKTHLLLINALKLSELSRKRVIMLTYNVALSRDIARIFKFTPFHDSYNEHGFKISTIHSFVFKICQALNLMDNQDDFFSKYSDL